MEQQQRQTVQSIVATLMRKMMMTIWEQATNSLITMRMKNLERLTKTTKEFKMIRINKNQFLNRKKLMKEKANNSN